MNVVRRRPSVAVASGLCLLATVLGSGGREADPGRTSAVPRPTTPLDAVLLRFNESILFHAGWDHGQPTADMAAGGAAPTKVEREPAFASGSTGRALADGIVNYAAGANLRLDMPGSVVFWLCISRTDPGASGEGYLFPLRIYAGDAAVPHGLLMVGKINRVNGCHLYVHAEASGQQHAQIHGVSTLGWRQGEWHLVVLTWRRGAIEFSVDGAPPAMKGAPILPATAKWFSLAASSNAQTGLRCLVDNVIVLDRPLRAEEIAWIHDLLAGGRKPGASPVTVGVGDGLDPHTDPE